MATPVLDHFNPLVFLRLQIRHRLWQLERVATNDLHDLRRHQSLFPRPHTLLLRNTPRSKHFSWKNWQESYFTSQAFLLYPIFVPYLMVLLSLGPVSRHILFQLICLTSAIDPAGYFQESKEVCVSRPGQVFSIFFNGYHKVLSCDLICSILQIEQLE